mgnify:CR=1 FL=1
MPYLLHLLLGAFSAMLGTLHVAQPTADLPVRHPLLRAYVHFWVTCLLPILLLILPFATCCLVP